MFQDCVTPSSGNQDDLLPPPPPAEPYEDFLARVGRDLSDSSRSATQLTAAARPCALVTTTTTGNRLPTPFPTYEVSSWTLQKQVQASRIRMPLPASYYAALPSPWVWPRWGSAVTNSVVRAFQFFWVPRPLLSSRPGTLYHRPPQFSPLWLPRWHNQMLWTLHRALPRTWSRTGRTSCVRWNLAGNSLLVTLHLSQLWVPLFLLRTWAPTCCSSWVPLTTERR